LIRENATTITVPFFAFGFVVLLLYEIFNFNISLYKANSILFLRDFFVILFFVFSILKLLTIKKYQTYFIVFISLFAGISALLNLPIFFFRYYEANIYGFDDFSQFRFLYRPLSFLSNDWVTVLLCFLPFPIIGLFKFWKNTYMRYGFLLIIGLLVFNLFISFSRAGILAFFLFILLLNVLFLYHNILSIKKILLFNTFLMFAVLFFCLTFASSVKSSINPSNSHQRSTEGRLYQWEQSFNIIKKHPFWGIGSKNYTLLGRQTQPSNLENSFTGRVNNTYIQLAIEKGIIGLIFWLSVIGICISCLFRQITKQTYIEEKAINIIILSAILAILFREIFFSSMFYKTIILFLFLLLLTFNLNNYYKPVKIRKSIVFTFIVLFVIGGLCTYSIKPKNALYYANIGLGYERSGNIEKAIEYYKKAEQLVPNDALFLHNLGRLYEMNYQVDSALHYLTQAVEIDPEVAIYHVSKGLVIENQNFEQAFESYKQAILLSPDIIDSQFFKDLIERYPEETEDLLNDAYIELLHINSIHYSSIIDAKIGKLQLSTGEIELAFKTLSHITRIHPNLSRPWFYLGVIEKYRGNYEQMLSNYRKSLFLFPSDHLPLYALAYYYENIGEEQTATSYYESAEKAWENRRSVHSSRCKRLYFTDTEKDDVVPDGFLDYIAPDFDNL
jgi:tetratricopeptide (TPR) repeat protein